MAVLSEGAGKINEDLVGFGYRSFWVMDGATGLWDVQLAGKSDAHWFVKEFDIYLTKNITKKSPLKDIVKKGVYYVQKKWQKLLDKKGIEYLPPYAEPSSSLVIVRFAKDYTEFEYLVLGDSVLSFIIDKNLSKVVKDKTLEKLDSKAVSILSSYLQKGYSYEVARKKILPILRKHRSLKNTPKGYWVLSFQEEAIDHAIYGKERINENARILALTDGFDAIISTYKLFNSYQKLMAFIAHQKELKTAYVLLRNIENNDPNCIKFPRLKPSDDASGVYMEIQL
ncbi:hypothetical protein A3L10_06820 [Thermococcus radiotolerans]|uniref:PPM-type phosphatase domain-containing protein n=2 Tax=Thermococcus radiotolerans TaxID=187880 RepID=A0A2Z2MZZ4_9EURY|nr:hypothetical protein A3L10_06820 [Thermococcus radiotolerans]